ncbi:SMP-30/gluconolactonase/LRE family protein [Spirosoma sp. BT702]|uniref:SMP-30/gluconolactonase/LRE family protein n=1 Tax=Spirosoma profusum TaxID=2771354 RepID=A0A926Y418_9BACT|nr:SMP-30/gluconolactonase/LRE family protein [Spirosoma profusum]MBD2702575.1 SMP-30/gluconolactonase/LRE family protein [Spirosoma profusum]
MDTIHVLAEGLKFPEGPTFDASGNLWCVEQEGEGLFCRMADGTIKRIHTGGRPNGAVYYQEHIWFCDSGNNNIRRLNPTTEEIEIIISHVSGQPLNKPNDLLFDAQNNLIVTCPGSPDDGLQGYVVVYSPDASINIIADGLSYPNGLALLRDSQTLLIAETHEQRIWGGFWDAEGLSWETIRVWTDVIEAPDKATTPGPDGMTLGNDGNLYVAVYGAGIIRVFSNEGSFIRDIKLPGQNPSNCTFDPSGKLGLIVTETERGELLSVTF